MSKNVSFINQGGDRSEHLVVIRGTAGRTRRGAAGLVQGVWSVFETHPSAAT